MLEANYRLALRAGWIPDASNEIDFWRDTFSQFSIDQDPLLPWEKTSYELRLLNLQCDEQVTLATKGHSELAHELRRAADDIWDLVRRIGKLSSCQPVMIASYQLRSSIVGASALMDERRALIKVAEWLEANPQPPRWRGSEMRNNRIRLAVKASPLFETLFGEEAKPAGGSTTQPIHECNLWTRFFQALAFVFYGERETPDRQRVLWAAFRHPGSRVGYLPETRMRNR